MAASPVPTTSPAWARWLAWAGACALVAGALLERLDRQIHWPRVAESLVLLAIAALAGWIMRRWRGWPLAAGIALAWLVALVVSTGPVPLLAVLLLASLAHGLGSFLSRGPIGLVAGLAILAGLAGWLVHLPLHHRWSWTVSAVLVVGWRHRVLRDAASASIARLRAAIEAAPRAAAVATALLGLASTGTWLPTVQFDDVAYHLGLPSQLAGTGMYALDPSHQAWALAPWAGDVLHGLAQLIAGREARGALNALWLVLLAACLHGLAGALGASPRLRWAAVALAATLPLTVALAAGMQTELAAGCALLALAWCIVAPQAAGPHPMLTGGALLGLLIGLKALHPLAALPLLAWALWLHRGAISPARMLGAAAIAMAVGGSSYAQAWRVAGNPVLPLFNGWFRSPYFPPEDFDDPRWHAGLDWAMPWRMAFDGAHRYGEGFAGHAGLAWIGLAGLLVLAMTRPGLRGFALAAAAGLVLTLVPVQYARYAWPSLLLLVAAACAAATWLPRRDALSIIGLTCAMQLLVLANATWELRTGALKLRLLAGSDAVLERYAPARLAWRGVPADGRNVLVAGPRPLAETGTRGRATAWYDPPGERAARAANADPGGAAWIRYWREENIGHVLAEDDAMTPALRRALERAGAREAHRAGTVRSWQLPEQLP